MQRNKHKEKAWIAVVRKHNYLISKLFKKKNICWSHLLQSNSSDRVQVSWSSQSTINRIRNKGLHIYRLASAWDIDFTCQPGKSVGVLPRQCAAWAMPCHQHSRYNTQEQQQQQLDVSFINLDLFRSCIAELSSGQKNHVLRHENGKCNT